MKKRFLLALLSMAMVFTCLLCPVTMAKSIVPVKSVSLSKASVTIITNNTYNLKATINPTSATTKTIAWSSSNTAIASVNSSGKVSAKKTGTCTITAKSNNGKIAKCKVTVTKVPNAIVANPTIDAVQVGGDDVTPTGFKSAGVGQSIAWISDTPSVATVDLNTGVIHAVAAGTTYISYAVVDNTTGATIATGSDKITVYAAPTVVNPIIGTVQVGKDDVTPTGFTAAGAGQLIVWESETPSVATVNLYTGVIHAVAAGTTNIGYGVVDITTGEIIVIGYDEITVVNS